MTTIKIKAGELEVEFSVDHVKSMKLPNDPGSDFNAVVSGVIRIIEKIFELKNKS